MERSWRESVCPEIRVAMKLLFLLLIPAVVFAQGPDCDSCIRVNTTCYNVTYLFDLDADFRKTVVINEMDLLRTDDILYYSFEPNIDDAEYYKVGFVNIAEPTNHGILTASNYSLNLGTFDVDQVNNVIYLGGSDGVYKFDTKAKKFEHFSSHGDTILSLFYKNNVYFVRNSEKEIIVKKGNEFESILLDDKNGDPSNVRPKVTIKKFVITNNNVVVFLSSFGLYVTTATKNADVFRLSQNPFFRGLTMDLDGEVYAWWLDGIYKVVLEDVLADSKVVKVAHVPTIGCMTFDNSNNILLTMDKSLFQMTKTNITAC
ncbi:unnamed protein product [Plutella xylostella]|uniref:(diamondback moth) hypothetical protein n=1 Tax=Plutella xylostella TaxID=51655 RepID=A0A8S4FMB5_PLUXY|nr:unnamed protein product [Plutella xylostella]